MKLSYRKEALDTISSPEQLDQYAKIIRPSSWLFIAGIGTILIAVLIWSLTGNITDGVRVSGIIFPNSGVMNLTSPIKGTVTDVLVQDGEYVEQGQTILVIPNNELIDKIKIAKAQQLSPESYAQYISEYEDSSLIKTKVSGTIQNIVAENALVSAGNVLAGIVIEDRSTNSKELIAFIPLSISKKFKIGMEAQISPSFAPREEYGFIKGFITKLGTTPVTHQYIEKTFGSLQYEGLLPEENCIEVRIALNIDSSSKNGFEWSNDKGKELMVDTYTYCSVFIVIGGKRPINLLFRL